MTKLMRHLRITSIIAGVILVFTLAVGSSPVLATNWNVLEADIIRCGNSGTANGCGSNIAASDPLSSGQVQVRKNGQVRVLLQGAAPYTTYTIFVGNWVVGGHFQVQYQGSGPAFCSEGNISIGTVKTNSQGNFRGTIMTPSGQPFAFPAGTSIGQPNFAFNNPPCPVTQFTTGFTTN